MKALLLTLLPLLLTNSTNLNINNESFNELTTPFEKSNYFILSETLVTSQETIYKEVDSFFYTFNDDKDVSNYSLTSSNEEIFSVENFTFNESQNRFDFSLIGHSAGEALLNLTYKEVTYTSNVYVKNSYINFQDFSITKPTSSKNNTIKFDIKLVDGYNISGVDQSEISYEILENENKCIRKLTIGEIVPQYGIRLQTTQNTGKAVIRCNFKHRNKNNELILVDSFDVTINVLDQDNYYTFYDLNENNEFVEISLENPLKVQSFSKKSIYIGNLTDNFNPKDFEIKNEKDLGGVILYELNVEESFDFPLLRLDFVLGQEIRTYDFSIGIKDSKITKDIAVQATPSDYKILINYEYLDSYYHITKKPEFYTLYVLNRDFIRLVDTNGEDVKGAYPVISKVPNRLGKQRAYIEFNIDGEVKTHKIDYKITMSPQYANNVEAISNETKATLYKNFIKYINNDLPGYYSLEEAYYDLEFEYKALNSDVKNMLASDYEFIKEYRHFIVDNDFDASFFSEISINLGFNRYVLPVVIIVIVVLMLVATLASCFYFVYRTRGKEDE